MKKKLPYFCWYPGDFDNDENVRLMDLEQVGLYAKCLNHAWMTGSLPKDREEIRRLLRLSKAQFDRAWVRVEPCFMEDPERPTRLINPRQEIERCAAKEKSLTNRRAAKERWEKKRNANAYANACGTQYNPRYDSDSDSVLVVSGKESLRENPPPLVPDSDGCGMPLYERLIGLFVALGRGVGVTDAIRCENAWKGLTPGERKRAHDYAFRQQAEWQSRPTNKIPQPWNYLSEGHWNREVTRILEQSRAPTKGDLANQEAGRRFREMPR